MNPIVHPVVGYLCYAGYARVGRGERPTRKSALVAVFAAVLPDLIDQPLRLLGVTPVGRTAAHSLLVAVPVVIAVGVLWTRRGRPAGGVAFAIGYLSHLAADVPWHVLAGDYDELGFLLWPLTPMPAYTGTKVLGHVGGIEVTTRWFEAAILLVGLALFLYDRRSGSDD